MNSIVMTIRKWNPGATVRFIPILPILLLAQLMCPIGVLGQTMPPGVKCSDAKNQIEGKAINWNQTTEVEKKQLIDLASCEALCCNTGLGNCAAVTYEKAPSYWCRIFNCENEADCGGLVDMPGAVTTFNIFETMTSITNAPAATTGAPSGTVTVAPDDCPPKSGSEGEVLPSCTDKFRAEYLKEEIIPGCANEVGRTKMNTFESCWAYCCHYTTNGCTTVTFYVAPSYECVMYDCTVFDDCPRRSNNLASTAFVLVKDAVCPEKSDPPGELVEGRCADISVYRGEFTGEEIDQHCASEVNRIKLKDFESCWAYCCDYDTNGCTSVTYHDAPDYDCIMYACTTEEECPRLNNSARHTAFVRLASFYGYNGYSYFQSEFASGADGGGMSMSGSGSASGSGMASGSGGASGSGMSSSGAAGSGAVGGASGSSSSSTNIGAGGGGASASGSGMSGGSSSTDINLGLTGGASGASGAAGGGSSSGTTNVNIGLAGGGAAGGAGGMAGGSGGSDTNINLGLTGGGNGGAGGMSGAGGSSETNINLGLAGGAGGSGGAGGMTGAGGSSETNINLGLSGTGGANGPGGMQGGTGSSSSVTNINLTGGGPGAPGGPGMTGGGLSTDTININLIDGGTDGGGTAGQPMGPGGSSTSNLNVNLVGGSPGSPGGPGMPGGPGGSSTTNIDLNLPGGQPGSPGMPSGPGGSSTTNINLSGSGGAPGSPGGPSGPGPSSSSTHDVNVNLIGGTPGSPGSPGMPAGPGGSTTNINLASGPGTPGTPGAPGGSGPSGPSTNTINVNLTGGSPGTSETPGSSGDPSSTVNVAGWNFGMGGSGGSPGTPGGPGTSSTTNVNGPSGAGSHMGSPSGPGGPGFPSGPSGPGSPSGPSGPGSPGGPSGPGSPSGPSGPFSPSGPSGPGSPSGPSGPGSPSGPSGPGSSSGPSGPGFPSGPSGPGFPSGPSGLDFPSGPSGPGFSSGSSGPGFPSGPSGPGFPSDPSGSGFPSGSISWPGRFGPKWSGFPSWPSGPGSSSGQGGHGFPSGPSGPGFPNGPGGPGFPSGPGGPGFHSGSGFPGQSGPGFPNSPSGPGFPSGQGGHGFQSGQDSSGFPSWPNGSGFPSGPGGSNGLSHTYQMGLTMNDFPLCDPTMMQLPSVKLSPQMSARTLGSSYAMTAKQCIEYCCKVGADCNGLVHDTTGRCVAYNCPTQEDCPMTHHPNVHTYIAYTRIPMRTTQRSQTQTMPQAQPTPRPTLPTHDLCDVSLTLIENVKVTPRPSARQWASLKVATPKQCTEYCCRLGKECTALTFNRAGQCMLYECPTQRDCPVAHSTDSLSYLAVARMPIRPQSTGSSTLTMTGSTSNLLPGSNRVPGSTLTLSNSGMLTNGLPTNGNMQLGNSLTGVRLPGAGIGKTVTGMANAGTLPMDRLTGSNSMMGSSSGGSLTSSGSLFGQSGMSGADGQLSGNTLAGNGLTSSSFGSSIALKSCPFNMENARLNFIRQHRVSDTTQLDERCLVWDGAPRFPDEHIDNRCASPMNVMTTSDEVACFMYCCQHTDNRCTSVSYDHRTGQCSAYACLSPLHCPTTRSATASTHHLRAPGFTTRMLSTWNRPWTASDRQMSLSMQQLTQRQTAGSMASMCNVDLSKVRRGRIMVRRDHLTVLGTISTPDLLTCMSQCCHTTTECNAITYEGSPTYTCTMHKCMNPNDCMLQSTSTMTTISQQQQNVCSAMMRGSYLDFRLAPSTSLSNNNGFMLQQTSRTPCNRQSYGHVPCTSSSSASTGVFVPLRPSAFARHRHSTASKSFGRTLTSMSQPQSQSSWSRWSSSSSSGLRRLPSSSTSARMQTRRNQWFVQLKPRINVVRSSFRRGGR